MWNGSVFVVAAAGDPSPWIYVLGALVTGFGASIAAYLGNRGRNTGGEDRWERRERRRLDRARKQVPITVRITRLEHWKEQRVDPLLDDLDSRKPVRREE